jgi:hypothetical protein
MSDEKTRPTRMVYIGVREQTSSPLLRHYWIDIEGVPNEGEPLIYSSDKVSV